jgi:3-oxoacyl-(acyl-carrier-protein) synthase
MKRRRVKITGIGPVTPAGIGREEFWQGILEPVSRVRPFKELGDEYGPLVAAYIDRFNVAKYVDRTLLPKGAARQTMFAVAGAVLAVQDAGILKDELETIPCAVVTGSSIMDFGGTISSLDAVKERGPKMAQPRVLYGIGIGSAPSAVARALGIAGRTLGLSNQCSSGLDAIGYAASLVANGEVDIAICGGTEAPLHRFPLIELRAAELTPATTERPGQQARPFDLWRTTGVVGEGCSMFVLEPETSQRPGYSFVSGYGFANDKDDDLCGGMVEASKIAMGQAGVRTNDIEVLSAWGPGHKLVDAAEARAMTRLFGSTLRDLAAVSIKGSIGTPLGAAPAIQVAAAAMGQKFGAIPPTVNWEYPDPACPFNLSNRARIVSHRITLVNSHGLGAVNSGMVLERC